MSDTQPQFGKWRSMLWPVHGFELKKLLPMFFMFFFISFNYTILRDTKDTLIVTAAGSGAQAIPFLKVYGVVPFAILFMILYSKMSNVLTKERLFYATIIPFIVFFGLFATVLYPLKDVLHPHAFADTLQAALPEGLSGLVAVVRNWTFSLFYIMAELWGSVVLSLLFWGFANDTTKVGESKRFYSLFGIGANIALLVSGPAIILASNIRASLPANVDAWQVSLNYLMGMVVAGGCIVIAIYRWINKNVLTDERFYDPALVKKKKDKPKMSVGESFKFIFSSKYLLCIAALVIAYGISINLVEVTWKGQLKLQYPNANDYSAFMGKFSFVTGIVSTIMMIFVGGNVMRRFGWKTAAMITPIVLMITGGAFFSFVLFRDSLSGFISMLGSTPLMLAVLFGAAQNIMSKSAKYSLFDPTKEMAYIPLDQESKVKGKAAVDVVGARLGKSGGSLIQQGLLIGVGGQIALMAPYVAGILVVVIGGWMVAVRALNRQFLERTMEQPAKATPLKKAAKKEKEAALS